MEDKDPNVRAVAIGLLDELDITKENLPLVVVSCILDRFLSLKHRTSKTTAERISKIWQVDRSVLYE